MRKFLLAVFMMTAHYIGMGQCEVFPNPVEDVVNLKCVSNSLRDSLKHNIEFNYDVLNIHTQSIKYRNFIRNNIAFRSNLILSKSTDIYVTAQAGDFSAEDAVSPQLHDIYSTISYGASVGYEWHLKTSNNFSPYIGVEGYFIVGKDNYEQEFWGPNEIDNIGQLEKNVTWSILTSNGFRSTGLDILLGTDYYFTDMMYVGIETGIGLGSKSVTNFEYEISDLVAYNLSTGGAPDDDAPVSVAEFDEFDLNYGFVSNSYLGNDLTLRVRLGLML